MARKPHIRQMVEVIGTPAWLPVPAVVAGLLALIGALAIADLALDSPESWLGLHTVVESVFIAVCLATAAYLGWAWHRSRTFLVQARSTADWRLAERDVWKSRADVFRRGLSEAIDSQFAAWALTPAEAETARLLLKGLSLKEIADVSHRSERTARQHAVAVYRKSGLAGRAELAGYFLEDLLSPAESPPA